MSEQVPAALRRAQLQSVVVLKEAMALLGDVEGWPGAPPADLVRLHCQTTAILCLADQVITLADAMNAIAAKLEGGRHG